MARVFLIVCSIASVFFSCNGLESDSTVIQTERFKNENIPIYAYKIEHTYAEGELDVIPTENEHVDLSPAQSSDEDPRILKGRNVTSHKYPFMVSIQQRINNLKVYNFCGGVIIDPYWILTAAHCFDDFTNDQKADIRIRAGVLIWHDKKGQFVDVKKRHLHEAYDPNGTDNDIALLRLRVPLKLNQQVQPIALPEKVHKASGNGTIMGWGAVDVNQRIFSDGLLDASLTVVPNQICQNKYRDVIDDLKQLCIGGNGPPSICLGDSGGPFVQSTKNGPTVVGIVSFGNQKCNGVKPTVFTRVAAFSDWIKKTMKLYP